MTTSFAKDKIRIVLLEGVHPSAAETFRAAGYNNVTEIKTALTGSELIAAIESAHIVGIRSRTQMTGQVLAAARRSIALRRGRYRDP